MIPFRKLEALAPGHRVRKLAQVLRSLEVQSRTGMPWDREYARELILLASKDDALPEAVRNRAAGILSSEIIDTDALNLVRNDILMTVGLEPSDWDFVTTETGALDRGARKVFPGMKIFMDDIRSPFNVGSIFRSADAFGVSEILLTAFCADPRHKRSLRTAMGATEIISWKIAEAGGLAGFENVFALELGGTPLDEFEFPETGIVVFGSEELGISPEAAKACTRRVSIPMFGAKASVNVGVAAGILLNAWAASLDKR